MAIEFVQQVQLSPSFSLILATAEDFGALTLFPPPGLPNPPPLSRVFYVWCSAANPNTCGGTQIVYPAFRPGGQPWGGLLILRKPEYLIGVLGRLFVRSDTLSQVVCDVFKGSDSDL